MKMIPSILLMNVVLGVLPGCGKGENPSPPQTGPARGVNDVSPSTSADPSLIYGTWVGDGTTSDGTSYQNRLVLQPGKAWLEKTCFYSDGKSLTTAAEGTTFDEADQTAVTLVGGLSSWILEEGRRCWINFPASLQFIASPEGLLIRITRSKRKSSMVKVSD